jgi:hypothetical protein
VGHRPGQLDKGIRWIERTPDQDAIGFLLPATAEPEGYTAEKAKGNLRVLPPSGKFRADIRLGALTVAEASAIENKVTAILSG